MDDHSQECSLHTPRPRTHGQGGPPGLEDGLYEQEGPCKEKTPQRSQAEESTRRASANGECIDKSMNVYVLTGRALSDQSSSRQCLQNIRHEAPQICEPEAAPPDSLHDRGRQRVRGPYPRAAGRAGQAVLAQGCPARRQGPGNT